VRESLAVTKAPTFVSVVVATLVVASTVTFGVPTQEHGVQAAPVAPVQLDGYWMVDSRGHVHTFGNAPHLGEGVSGTVDMASTRTGSGYWLVDATGLVVARGDAGWLGDRPPLAPGETVVAIAGDPNSAGAWIFTSRGVVHSRGGAPELGGVGSISLNQPIIDAAPAPDGRGYWLVGADGGVFAFGSAGFHGSMGGKHLNGPVVGIAPAPDGSGYWLVANDGGIFTFGGLAFHGSMGGRPLNRAMNGMVAAGGGYLMVADDGGAFAFGPGVNFHGSLGGFPNPWAVVAIEPVPAGATPQPLGPDPRSQNFYEPVPAHRVAASWRAGCPVPLSDLYLITVDHWDMAGRMRTGELVVNIDQVAAMTWTMKELHRQRFPIAQMELVDIYGANDDASMAANNTSAFNCRAVTGGSSFSTHSWGRAIDINPVQNPYVRGTTVLPPAGAPYVSNRSASTPGLITGASPIVALFSGLSDGGWEWGGNWSSPKDYQHFESRNARR
jgi:D-alanyl-D-alanine carboxypeptidase